MVNYEIHENGWTVVLRDFDFKTATQEDADTISHLLSTNIAVIARNQDVIKNLTSEDALRFCSMIGKVKERDRSNAIGRAIVLGDTGAERYIQRVTATKNEEGHPGLFGQDDELDWHCNQPWDINRNSFVWLRSAAGANGSRTSITNTIKAFEDLRQEDPDFIAELEEKQYRVVTGWRKEGGHTSYYKYWQDYQEASDAFISEQTAMPLIMTNESGKKGFFLPFLQSHMFFGYSPDYSRPIMERIWNYCVQDKYIFNMDWVECDEIMMMEQWLSVHKRWAYNHNPDRVLHRMELNFENATWFQGRKKEFRRNINDVLRLNLKELKQR